MCLLAYGRWLSLVNPASATTKTGRHDIAETLMKVGLSTISQIKLLIKHHIWTNNNGIDEFVFLSI
jgi:ribosome biogenesis protein Nip4